MPRPDLRLQLPDFEPPSPGAVTAARGAVKTIIGLGLLFLITAIVVISTVRVAVTITANGLLETKSSAFVRARASGSIVSITVGTGDSVRQGQIVGSLDSLGLLLDLQAVDALITERELAIVRSRLIEPIEIRQRHLRAATAKARVIQLEAAARDRLSIFGISASLDSIRVGHRFGQHAEIDRVLAELLVGEAEWSAALADLGSITTSALDAQLDRSTLQSLRARRALLRRRLHDLLLVAPRDGIVLTSQVDQLLGSNVQEGHPVLVISDRTSWRARLVVAEEEIRRVAIGDSVQLDMSAFRQTRERRIEGLVTFIAPAARDASGVQRATDGFEVVVDIPHETLPEPLVRTLRPGYTVTGKIITRRTLISELLWDKLESTRTHN